jgi:DNA-binding CsgD family transcriptional regulator/PAS domain-containing protein
MENVELSCLRQSLQAQRTAIVALLTRKTLRPLDVPTIHQHLGDLLDQILTLLFGAALDDGQAQHIGALFAHQISAQPEALGLTLECISRAMLVDRPASHRSVLQSRLLPLFNAVFTGFVRHTQHEATQAFQKRLTALVTDLPLVLFEIDCQGMFTLVEGRGVKRLDLTADAVIGRSIFDLARGNPHIIENIRSALAGAAFLDIVEARGCLFQTYYRPLRNDHGAISGVRGAALDITDQERLRAERDAARRQLQQALAYMADAQKGLPEAASAAPDSPAMPLRDKPLPMTSADRANDLLSKRELAVLQRVAAGLTNAQIARELVVAPSTIKTHLEHIFSKLAVHHRAEAVTRAWELGLLT